MDTEKRIKKVSKSPRYGEVWNEPKAPSKKFIPTTVKNVRRKSFKRRFFTHFVATVIILTFIRFASHTVVGIENLTVSMFQRWYSETIADLAYKAGFDKPTPLPKDFTIKNGISGKMKSLKMSPGLYPVIRGIVKRESLDNPYAESKAGAKGYGQLMPATTVKCGMSDPKEAFNGPKNIDCTVWYFNEILKDNDGDLILAMMAYNAGQKNIGKSEENRNYVQDVFKAMLSLPASELIWED